MKIETIDKKIRILRIRVRKAKDLDECYFYFELLDKTQRERFAKFGSFLPSKNGKVHTYSPDEDMWLSWV